MDIFKKVIWPYIPCMVCPVCDSDMIPVSRGEGGIFMFCYTCENVLVVQMMELEDKPADKHFLKMARKATNKYLRLQQHENTTRKTRNQVSRR